MIGLPRSWWFYTSAVGGLLSYQVGMLVRRCGWLDRPASWPVGLGLAVCGAAAVTLTFDANGGPFVPGGPGVLVHYAAYGNMPWFLLTAAGGTLMVVFLAQAMAGWRWLAWVGELTLGLMGLNGILLRYVNLGLARRVARVVPVARAWPLTGACVGYTIVALAGSVAVAWALGRLIPPLIDRPFRRR
jgi:hypothetical protein